METPCASASSGCIEMSRNLCGRCSGTGQCHREQRRAFDLRLGNRQDIADEHVLEVFCFAGGLAHDQDSGGRSHGIGDADEGFLGMWPRRVRASAKIAAPKNVKPRLIQ